MSRFGGTSGVDKWLRRTPNRALLAAVVLLPCLFLLNSSRLPEVGQDEHPTLANDNTLKPAKGVHATGNEQGVQQQQQQRAGEGSGSESAAGNSLDTATSAPHKPRRRHRNGSPLPPPVSRRRRWTPEPPPSPPESPPASPADPLPGTMPFLLPGCKDGDGQCPSWRDMGECHRNPGYMFYNCPRACSVCNVTYLSAVPERRQIAPGVWMPSVGFGTAGLGDGTAEAVAGALRVGYRLLDSAQAREWYREDLVGAGLAASGVPRSEVFLTSKVHPRALGYWNTLASVRGSLADLRTDYLDLLLLHYPDCGPTLCPGYAPEGTWRDSWAAMEQLLAEGVVRAIGVANFDVVQLKELEGIARVPPALVQTVSEPRDPSQAVRAWCLRSGATHQAFSVLGTQHGAAGLLTHPVVRGVAVAHAAQRATPAQVLLAWALRHGSAVVPRSASVQHQRENLGAGALDLTPAEMQDIDGLDGA